HPAATKALVEAPRRHGLLTAQRRRLGRTDDVEPGIAGPRDAGKKALVIKETAVHEDGLPARQGLIHDALYSLQEQARLVVRDDEDANWQVVGHARFLVGQPCVVGQMLSECSGRGKAKRTGRLDRFWAR